MTPPILHDQYFLEPFPINFTSEEVSDFYYDNHKISYEDFKTIIISNDLFKIAELYEKMSDYFIESNFKRGCFLVLYDGYEFLEMIKKNKIYRNVMKEMKIDFSHFTGMGSEDLQIIVVPFKEFDDMNYFGYIIRKGKFVQYWVDGINKGSNSKFFKGGK